MAGLLNQTMAQDGAAPAGAPAEAPDDTVVEDEGESNVTPEEQEAKDDFVKAGFELMYAGGEVNPYILQLLDDDPADLKEIFGEALPLDEPGPDGRTMWESEGPVIALAAASVVIVLEVLRRMEQRPEDDIILHGGIEILEDIAEISRVSGKREYSAEEVGEALRKGADLFREAASEEGLIDTKAAAEEFTEIVDADRQGRIGEVLPQLGGQE